MVMDEQALYRALPPDQQREFDRVFQQAQALAEDIRADTERLAELCAVAEDIIAREPVPLAGANPADGKRSVSYAA